MSRRLAILCEDEATAAAARRTLEEAGWSVGASLIAPRGVAGTSPAEADADAAHDINNLLANLLGNLFEASRALDWLHEGADEETRASRDRLAAAIEASLSGCHRLRSVGRSMLAYGRVRRQERVPVQINALLDEAVDIVAPELRNRAHLERTYAAGIPEILAEETPLCQVFVNLLLNSVQAIDAGAPDTSFVRVVTGVEETRVRIDVVDSGAGIPADVLPRILDPFFTVRPEGEGTGLGLAVSRAIVEGHGGELRIRSEVGHGTTASVFLPIPEIR
jgi:signal transduction histidine kinase